MELHEKPCDRGYRVCACSSDFGVVGHSCPSDLVRRGGGADSVLRAAGGFNVVGLCRGGTRYRSHSQEVLNHRKGTDRYFGASFRPAVHRAV
jgi:hypothetical protein